MLTVSYVKYESLFISMQNQYWIIKLNSIKLKASGGSRPLDKVGGGGGRGWGGHSDPQIRKNPVSKKTFLAQFGLKIKGKSDPGEARIRHWRQ